MEILLGILWPHGAGEANSAQINRVDAELLCGGIGRQGVVSMLWVNEAGIGHQGVLVKTGKEALAERNGFSILPEKVVVALGQRLFVPWCPGGIPKNGVSAAIENVMAENRAHGRDVILFRLNADIDGAGKSEDVVLERIARRAVEMQADSRIDHEVVGRENIIAVVVEIESHAVVTRDTDVLDQVVTDEIGADAHFAPKVDSPAVAKFLHDVGDMIELEHVIAAGKLRLDRLGGEGRIEAGERFCGLQLPGSTPLRLMPT